MRFPGDTSVVVAAFVVNELKDRDRVALLENMKQLVRLSPGQDDQRKTAESWVSIVEPISQRISPWWNAVGGGIRRASVDARILESAHRPAADGEAAGQGRGPAARHANGAKPLRLAARTA